MESSGCVRVRQGERTTVFLSVFCPWALISMLNAQPRFSQMLIIFLTKLPADF